MDHPTADVGFKNPCISAYFVSFLYYIGVSRGFVTDIENARIFDFNLILPVSVLKNKSLLPAMRSSYKNTAVLQISGLQTIRRNIRVF